MKIFSGYDITAVLMNSASMVVCIKFAYSQSTQNYIMEYQRFHELLLLAKEAWAVDGRKVRFLKSVTPVRSIL